MLGSLCIRRTVHVAGSKLVAADVEENMVNDGKWYFMMLNDSNDGDDGQSWLMMLSNGYWWLTMLSNGQWWLIIVNIDISEWLLTVKPIAYRAASPNLACLFTEWSEGWFVHRCFLVIVACDPGAYGWLITQWNLNQPIKELRISWWMVQSIRINRMVWFCWPFVCLWDDCRWFGSINHHRFILIIHFRMVRSKNCFAIKSSTIEWFTFYSASRVECRRAIFAQDGQGLTWIERFNCFIGWIYRNRTEPQNYEPSWTISLVHESISGQISDSNSW